MQIQRNILESAGVSQEGIQQLEVAWNAYQAAAVRTVRQIPHVVCTGIYNAGKSTLLNALTDSEQFPTGDIPTTKEIAKAEYDGAVYVDTPGLNAEGADDRETAAAYESADLILFVSNAQNGGLLESEAKWLERLRVRFVTAEELNAKLIYVLSQCSQVDEDRLPMIREKFEEDISSVLGMKLQTMFQTDALVYTQGRAQKEVLLVEASRIQELRTYLAERVKTAAGSLEADYQRQLELAGQTCLAALADAENYCDKRSEYLETKLLHQKQELKKVWSEFSSALGKDLGGMRSPYIRRNMNHPSHQAYDEVKDSSYSGAKRKAADCLRFRYNDREDTLRESVCRVKEEIALYLHAGPDSRYWSKLNQVNQEFESFMLKLLQMGVPLEQYTSINIEPDFRSNYAYFEDEIAHDLQVDVVRTDEFHSLASYIERECGTYEWTEEVRGLFGITTTKTMHYVCLLECAERKWKIDMDNRWILNCDRVERKINSVIDRFMQRLSSAANDRKAALEKQFNAYLDSMKPDGNGDIYQKALDHIAQLKKEASR